MSVPRWRITVLKLDHRPERDKRLTTHVGLTARAFGASEFWSAGLKDPNIEDTIRQVSNQWGNRDFKVLTGVKWKTRVHQWKEEKGEVIHLTMYGLHVDDVIHDIRRSRQPKLVVVGGPKVPNQVYQLADYNVAVGHQPHSEVAALSIFLDRLFEGQMLRRKFPDAVLRIDPTPHGKRIIESKEKTERFNP
ncbi:MAG: tRNA (cytidine(56)-2'-O)-methyltransferase [Promethearchaeota archaeon]